MSQSKAPREFKFVGAYSRKRRRRNGAASNGPTFCVTGAMYSPPQHLTTPIRQPHSGPRVPRNSDGIAENPIPEAADASIKLPEARAVRPQEDATNPVEGNVLLYPLMETFDLDNEIDWHYMSLMNPFMNSGQPVMPRIDQLGGLDQLPVYFGPDAAFLHLDEGSSSDSSPQNNSAPPIVQEANADLRVDSEAALEPPSVGEIIAPSMSSQQASGSTTLVMTQLLTRYDQEFCVLPLTHDFAANPFRFDAETARSSELLLHCILALSYKHLNRDTGSCANEATLHKKQALRMLRDMEAVSQVSPLEATFLDAILVLMTLDCATSAQGPWVSHLKRAYSMIQANESLNNKRTPRMQARIEMLVWWDVTLALTSRQGCVLSESAMVNLLNRDGVGDKTFYGVSGCPEALFRHMVRLGRYAREVEVVMDMTCVKFDMGPVLVVEHEIRDWTDPEYHDPHDDLTVSDSSSEQDLDLEEAAHYKEDFRHCAEAWRNCLLIYIARVFKWKRDGPAPKVLRFLARKTLNHVQSCRYTSMLQKQLLLPVFLAGCETRDEHLRQVARTYCSWWNERTRYDMFLTANVLLEEVWSDDSPQAWWGSVIDQKSRSNGAGDTRQYLFG